MLNHKKLVMCASSGAIAFVLASGAWAQAAAETDGGVQEIVVTAQKRSESINKVGMSINAFTGESLVQKNISLPSDLIRVIPGFTYTEATRGAPVFAIRGVGFDDSTLGSASTVALYVDEVPISYPMEARFPTLDLERVEVLKGPQGILFGQNSTAGAINFIAAKPTDTVQAGFDASYGRFDTIEMRGFLSAPVSDTLKVRISAMGTHSSGWQKSYTRDDKLGAKRQFAARMLTVWEPGDALTVTMNLNGWIDKSDTQAGQLQNVSPVSPGISQAANPGYLYPSYPLAPQNPRAADWDANPRRALKRDDNYLQGSLRLDYELDDNLKITSISAFQRYNQEFGLDTDGTAIEDFLIYDKGYIHSLNQELRLTGDYDQLKFILGANYSRDRIHQENRYNYAQSSAFFAFSGPNFFNYTGPTGSAGNRDDQKVRSMAVFGNVDYSINDLITLHAGIRYTKDKRHYVGCTSDGGEGTVSDLYNILYPLLFGRPFNIQPGECTSATITATDVIIEPVDFKLNEDNISWRAGVDFQVTPTTLLYANVSRGYKSGSFPAINVIANAQLAGVKQESVLVYEAGFKAGLFDRKVQLNAAAFYNDYSDKQLRGRILDPFGVVGILDKLLNVPKSRVVGGEVELKVVPMRGLDLDFSATYTDTKVTKSFFAYDPVGNFFDHKGLPFPHTPKWNVNASANYEFPVSGSLNMFAGASLTYRSGSISVFADRDLVATVPLDPANKPGVLVPRDSFDETSYTLIDAQLGIADPDGKWRAWIWGKNIFNTYYWSNATQSFDSIYRIASMPATYGASVSLRF